MSAVSSPETGGIDDTEALLEFCHHLLDEAGALALSHFGRSRASFKEDGSVVTEADLAVQAHIRGALSRRFPAHGFVGEEEGAHHAAPGTWWILDPIDGTDAFQRGLPTWCVSLGLVWEGEPLLAMVDLPACRSRYWAVRGQGAWRDGERIQASAGQSLGHRDLILVSSNLHQVARPRTSARVHAYGSTCAHLCFTAVGAAQAAVLGLSHPWDYLAAGLILEEAGGALFSATGERLALTQLAATRPTLFAGVACHPDRALATFASLKVDPIPMEHAFLG